MMTAEAVVTEALWAVDRGLTAHVPGPLNQAVATLTRFLPRALSAKVAGAVLKGHVGAPR
jgi:short-subunit dehydrogenase